MRYKLKLITALTFASLQALADPLSTSFELADPLGPDVRLVFKTQGCFHHETVVITISKTPLSAEVENESGIRPIVITKKDLIALDYLLNFYRFVDIGQCTSTEVVDLDWVSEDKVLETEHLYDSSCLHGSWQEVMNSGSPGLIEVFTSGVSLEQRTVIEKVTLTLSDLISRGMGPPLPIFPTHLGSGDKVLN